MVVPDCGQKRQSLAHFQDDAGKNRGEISYNPPVILRVSVPVSDAGPSGTGSEHGDKALAAHRLGHYKPETSEHHDQREAQPQPLLHVRPLPSLAIPCPSPDERDSNKGQD
jgi:hypothetical protein